MNSNNNITTRSNLFLINNYQNNDSNANFFYKNDFESRSLSKYQFVIPHNESLICFQKCSKWFMNISTKNSNYITISGKIMENPQNTYISQNFRLQKNLESYFPIDMGAYKIFNIYGSAKYPLNLGFCINTSKISKVDERFYKSNFHIEINGILSHINKNVEIFKVPENFTATGMEIVQRIKEHLSYIVNYNINTPSNNNYYEFTIPIFKDGTFYVSFSISKKSFLSYINSKSKIFYDLFKYEVKITKLFFNYGLPLIIFCQTMPLYKNIQINNISNNNNNNINKILDLKEEKLSNKMLLLDEYEKNMPENYCNFRRFLSSITPLIYEFDNLKIKNIFDIFIKPSLYGCSVLYKNFSNLIYVNYFPSLNKVYIEHNFCLSHNTTIDSSFSNNSMYKTINFEENEDEIYWKKSYSEQIENLFNNVKELDDLEIGDISNNSYFSIIWIPFHKNYYNFDKLDNSINISFEIYYSFKLEHNNSGHKMKIIGLKIRDKNGLHIKDNNKNKINFNNENYFFINSHNNESYDINEEEKINFLEYFWFMNKSIDHFNSKSIGYSYEQMEIFNYNKYIFNLLKTHN